ncbi:MAG: imidazole glycerol phosphate synthase subunit HisH [Solirubrobacterales bacterium]
MAPSGARIAILDYGVGNLRSIEKALERVGAVPRITADPAASAGADGIVLPGVGAFPKAMHSVRERGFDELLADRVEAGTPVLGICLGMQLLFERSSELGGAAGLGLLAGEVTALDAGGLKVPHIGWEPVRRERASKLIEGMADETPFYFVHSFGVRPTDPGDVIGTAEWGERFTCAVARPPLYGVQFHPEKSSAAGLRLLANFAAIAGGAAGRASSPVAAAGSGPG